MSEKDRTIAPSPFAKAMNEYMKRLDSLADSFPLIMELLQAKLLTDARALEGLIQAIATPVDETDNSKRQFKIPPEDLKPFMEVNARIHNSSIAIEETPRQYVVSCVSQFDAYLGSIIKSILQTKPEILNSSEKEIRFSEMLAFNSLDEAREAYTEREVESVMRKSHLEHFTWLESKLKIELRVDLPSFPEFIELTERRNLFAHCNGIVNRQYLSVCQQNQVEGLDGIAAGDQLAVTPAYAQRCYGVLFEIGIKLGQVIWRKLKPDEISLADKQLNAVCYDLLQRKQYRLAINLLQFSTHTLKKHPEQEILFIMKVNRALAYYLADNKDECLKVIGETDWSACADKFKLAVAVLEERYLDAVAIMRAAGANHPDLNEFSYRQWPLFSRFRETTEFRSVFAEVFKQDFSYVETRASSLEEIIAELKKTRSEVKQARENETTLPSEPVSSERDVERN